MYINKISVNNNLSFKGEFDDFLKLYRKFYTFTSWNIYGKRHSKKLVEKFMKEEIKDLEKTAVKKKVEYDSLVMTLEQTKNNNSAMKSSLNTSVSTLEKHINSNETTIKHLEGSIASLSSTLSDLKGSNTNLQNIIGLTYFLVPINILISLIIPNTIYYLMFKNKDEFKYLKKLLNGLFL